MTLPSLWYLMHLAADSNTDGGYEAWGASIPGCPFIQIGHNRQIAWGITAALCDDVELYREKIHPVEPDRYLAGHQWRKIERRTEPVRLRRGAVIEKTVRSTHHGPIISDFPTPANAREVLAVQWTAHQASREFHSIYRVNQARTWKDFLDGLSHHSAPSLNFVYADRAGNIGYALAGNIPLRTKSPSLMPVEGWDQRNEWRGYIPFDELPRLYNPPSGTIATANNKITGARYPYYLSHFFEPAHRIRRINQLLSMRQKFTAADMAKIQQDEISLHAVDLIAALKPDLGKVPDDDALAKNAAAKLLAWDGNCTENSVEAAIFHVFHHRLLANLLIPDLGEDLFTSFTEILNLCIFPTDEILKNFRSRWFTQRSRRELVALSLCQACAELREALGENIGAWHWGKVHRLRLNHSLSRISLLRPLLSIGPIPTGGDGMTVNLGFYRHSNPYIETVGASLRCIIALGESVSSAFILPSGQSAHPLSAHYSDQTKLWQDGLSICLSEPFQMGSNDRCLLLKPC
jgi:penicillin amidase